MGLSSVFPWLLIILFFSSLNVVTVHAFTGIYGVNHGRISDNILPPSSVVTLLKAANHGIFLRQMVMVLATMLSEASSLESQRFSQPLDVPLGGVPFFPLLLSADDPEIGFYYLNVKMGFPPTELTLEFDTGSDISWIDCTRCLGCSRNRTNGTIKRTYNASRSSTSRSLNCSDPICKSKEDGSFGCTRDSNKCSFEILYGDASHIEGSMIEDMIHLDMYQFMTEFPNVPVPFLFGCGKRHDEAFQSDGIMGWGPGSLSAVNQLSNATNIVRSFTHCLSGTGEGLLILGEVTNWGMSYSPLVPNRTHYTLLLEAVELNGRKLPINASRFDLSHGREYFIDSGTTLAYLDHEIYQRLIEAITRSVSAVPFPIDAPGIKCFTIIESDLDSFPVVSFKFTGGGALDVLPDEYMIQEPETVRCIGFRETFKPGLTILGALTLKNKIVVFDLDRQRIGWIRSDCYQGLNITTLPSPPPLNHQPWKNGDSHPREPTISVVGGRLVALLVLYCFVI